MPSERLRRLLSELVFDAYPAIAKDLLNPLAELLRVSREACGSDTDKFLILLVIGVRTVEDPRFAKLSAADLEAGVPAVLPSLGVNTRSVAEYTGIPKETVRRKLAQLMDEGWIVRHGSKLCMTAQAYAEMAAARELVRSLAVRNWETISGLLVER